MHLINYAKKYDINIIKPSSNIKSIIKNIPLKNSVLFYGIHGKQKDNKDCPKSFRHRINYTIKFLFKALKHSKFSSFKIYNYYGKNRYNV